MDTVVREKIEWLWKPWIPIGKLTILEGSPKVGKTTIALQFAATLSRGWNFPDNDGVVSSVHVDPRNTVVLCAEDGLADTLAPRLDQADAEGFRVWSMTSKLVKDKAEATEQMVTLEDIGLIEKLVEDTKAALLVVDPIQAYLGRNVDMHRANETRPVLAALGAMAQRQKCAVVIIRHHRKAGGTAMDRGLGSIDFNAAARSIMLAARDPEAPKTGRILAHTACNLALEAESIKYSITEQDGFQWGEIDSRSAEDLCREADVGGVKRNVTGDATTWLRETLGDELLSSTEVKAKARRAHISDYALNKAKEKLNIFSIKQGAVWFWSVPSDVLLEDG